MQNEVKSILIVGVGGQGTLLASKLLGNAMVSLGYDVKVSEVHGMSQRGGSVVTYVRYGKTVNSPIIEAGEADLILSFEQLEAVRFLPFLKAGGVVVTNTQTIDPMPVITGAVKYPTEIIEAIQEKGINIITADALDLAMQAGSAKAVNVVLIGVMAKQLDIDKQIWMDTIETTVPPKFVELNKKAFDLGYNA